MCVLSWLQGHNKSDSVCVVMVTGLKQELSWLQGRNKSDSVCVVIVTAP